MVNVTVRSEKAIQWTCDSHITEGHTVTVWNCVSQITEEHAMKKA